MRKTRIRCSVEITNIYKDCILQLFKDLKPMHKQPKTKVTALMRRILKLRDVINEKFLEFLDETTNIRTFCAERIKLFLRVVEFIVEMMRDAYHSVRKKSLCFSHELYVQFYKRFSDSVNAMENEFYEISSLFIETFRDVL